LSKKSAKILIEIIKKHSETLKVLNIKGNKILFQTLNNLIKECGNSGELVSFKFEDNRKFT